ncbi:hypothetical protein FACS189444_1720 [Spirochaetia bacterium]|nr:hypothetical protein FACS189444_1720 [Spirochaetia bacterium]
MSNKTDIKTPTVFIQDALRREVEKRTKGNVTVLYDDTGIPSYMLRVPRFNVETIDSGLGRGVHPAFVVDGKEVNEIFIGQVNARIIDGRAYSIPGESADRNITFDEARAACTKKGKGWHLLSSWEYAALVMFVVKNKSQYYEKDWWEWVDGLKIVDGEIFALKDNAFETPETDWPSLNTFFDDVKGAPVLAEKVSHYSEENPKGAADTRNGDYTSLDEIAELSMASDGNPLKQEDRKILAQLLIEPTATPILSEISGSLYASAVKHR